MKRRNILFLVLCMALCGFLTVSGLAGSETEIRVGTVTVTDGNAADVLGDGTVCYTPSDGERAAVLCLNGAKTDALTVVGTSLTLEIAGDNFIRGGLSVNCPLTICGAGTLTVTGGITLAEDCEIILPSYMQVYAGNTNELDAIFVESPDADVYQSPYIRFESASCTVSYLPDGTCDGVPVEGKKYDGIPLTLPGALFTRTGYTQSGWRCADGSAEYTLGATVDEASDLIFYPVWMVNLYTVSFRHGNGKPDTVQTLAYGAALAAPEDPVRIGYRFCGWDRPIPETVPATDLIFTALWEICDHGGNTAQRSCSAETVCSECGKPLEKLPHSPAEDDGDCTTPIFCQVCGATVRIGSGGHRFGAWQTAPDGEAHRECRNDGCRFRETKQTPQSDPPESGKVSERDGTESFPSRTESEEPGTDGKTESEPSGENSGSQAPTAPSGDGCSSSLNAGSVVAVMSLCVLFRCRKKQNRKTRK